MKKVFTKSTIILGLLVCVVGVIFGLTNIDKKSNSNTVVRNVELTEPDIDYDIMFSKYEDAVLEYSKDDGYASFSGTIHYTSDEISEIDFVSLTKDNENDLAIEYSFDYDIDENLFYMNVEGKNTVVYLGRDPEYTNIANDDKTNRVVTFHLDDWMFYENKHKKEGMWVLNYAFMNYVVEKEKKEDWNIRLTTNYSQYIPEKSVEEEGYFYSKELSFLLSTGHTFAQTKTYEGQCSFYKVYGGLL